MVDLPLAWIPMEGKLVNNHWFDHRKEPRISASTPLGRLGSAKTDSGVSNEVNRRIIEFILDDQLSIRPGKIGVFRFRNYIDIHCRIEIAPWKGAA